MVLGIKQKVGANNSDTGRDDEQNAEDKEHEAINIVDLVGPERGEDEIHLNEDRAKRQNSTKCNDYQWFSIPNLLRNGSWDRIDTAREIWLSSPISTNNGSQQSQWEA